MSTEYKKLPIKRYPRPVDPRNYEQRGTRNGASILTGNVDAEVRYWKKFKNQVHIKEFAPVTHIQFSPCQPHHFAVSSSTRVHVYSTTNKYGNLFDNEENQSANNDSNGRYKVQKTISRFKDVVHGIGFRADGRLLCAGDETGLVQLFDMKSRAILRTFEGHTAGVHQCQFVQNSANSTQLATTSDDRSLRIWDIPSQSCLQNFENAHDDYVRALACSSTNSWMAVTGGYDHTIHVWDLRMNQSAMTLSLEQENGKMGMPVEAVLLHPGDTMLYSSSGNQLYAWDILGASSGRLLSLGQNHQKTITSMCLDGGYGSEDGLGGRRILTASLDQHVKIWDCSTLRVTHSIKYPAPLLSVGISPDDTHLVAGMVNGLLSIRERTLGSSSADMKARSEVDDIFRITAEKDTSSLSRHEKDMNLRGGSYRFFLRGQHRLPSADDLDATKDQKSKPKLLQFEKFLKAFEYGAALDAALSTNLPAVTVITLLEELNRRGDALKIALSSRDDTSLMAVLNFILRHFVTPRYSEILLLVLDMILDLYGSVIPSSPVICATLKKIRRKSREEIEFMKEMHSMIGMMDMFLEFSNNINSPNETDEMARTNQAIA